MGTRVVGVVLLLGLSVLAANARAQGGDGSLRGTVKDAQGGALPGVTVTATSPALLSSKRFKLGGSRDLEIATNVLNLLNAGRGTEYARGGANRQYNTVAYLQPGNLQAARSFQFDLLFRF